MQVLYWLVLEQIQFCSFDRRCKTCLDTKPVLYQTTKSGFVPAPKPALCRTWTNRPKTGFVPTLNQPLQNRLFCLLQNRLCADPKPTAPSRLCVCSKTSFVPSLNLLYQNRRCAYAQPAHQNRLCIGTKPVFSFWINISTVSEVRCDCQGLGLVARIEASILVFDTEQVLYWPVLGQIQFCGFDSRCKTCLDTKPVLYQGRFCSLTDVSIYGYIVNIHSYYVTVFQLRKLWRPLAIILNQISIFPSLERSKSIMIIRNWCSLVQIQPNSDTLCSYSWNNKSMAKRRRDVNPLLTLWAIGISVSVTAGQSQTGHKSVKSQYITFRNSH